MGSIIFNKQNGRQKRLLPGEDHISGLVFYSGNIPAAFGGGSVEATPEVRATATVTVTNIGVNNDTVFLYAIDPVFSWVPIAAYTKVAGDDTAAKVATAIAALINEGLHGYTAVANEAVITISARPTLGDSITSTPFRSYTNGATLALSATAFAGGADAVVADVPPQRMHEVADLAAAEELGIVANGAGHIAAIHYHIREAFRISPGMRLYVGIWPVPAGEHTFDEVDSLRVYAQNKLRQVGVWTPKPFATGHVALLQAQYAKAAEVIAPLEIYYSANLYAIATGSIPSMAALTGRNVHVLVGQDGAGAGAALFEALEASIGMVGVVVGATSLAAVHENIGWVEKFQLALPGGELDVPALANGVLVDSLPNNVVKSTGILDSKRVMFLKKYPNYTGTYINDTHGAIPASDDYAYAEDNRTMDKAIRGVYAALLPQVNGPALFTPARELDPIFVSFLQTQAGKALEAMEKAGELSGYTVFIDPVQDSYSTDTITVEITNTKRGVSRNFIINIGF